MPYYNERANKFSHERILLNSEIKDKLSEYKISFDLKAASSVIKEIKNKFISRNKISSGVSHVFTVDSSYMEVAVNEEIPTAKIGLINFSAAIINLNKKSDIHNGRFIDPQKFNDMYKTSMLTFVCPTYNVVPKDEESLDVLSSIRKEIYKFYSESSPYGDISLMDSLYALIFNSNNVVELACSNVECPSRDANLDAAGGYIWAKGDGKALEGICSACSTSIYFSDYLRLHEAVDIEFGNSSILTRMAQITEHLMNINAIDTLVKRKSYDIITRVAFVIDGPLAIYGEPAKMHRHILKYLHQLSKLIGEEIVYFGLMKTGKLKDHFSLLVKRVERDEQLPIDSYMLIDDQYRFRYVQKPPKRNDLFGQEVAFGQDFLYYSEDKKKIVLSLLYPMEEKTINIRKIIFDANNYKNLGRILALLNDISIDIYEDAVLPVTLAHKYAAISLNPGVNIMQQFFQDNLAD